MNRSFLVTAFIFPLLLLSQLEEDFIKWDESRKLTWDDFKAAPLKMGSTAAMTTTHLGFSYNVSNGKITFKIDCQFEKNKSWGLVKNDWILKHEQGHFDITEIFARKLHKELLDYKFSRRTFRQDVNDIYDRIVKEKENFQFAYDGLTDHSRNKTVQKEWLEKIQELLIETEPYSDYP